ncbi:MAG TPA: TIGR02996 domain-containing protein [Kofleriaceae bacterium]|nr:TIGR02996 domain-containing protein [Kofleriaceae bacterium]
MARTRATAGEDSLERALDDLRDNRLADALAKLLVAWRRYPGPRLSEVIAMLSNRTRTQAPAIRGKTAVARAAWTKLATLAPPTAIPALLDSLCDAPSSVARERLAHLERWMPDPRVDDWLVRMLETMPYRATSTQSFWTRLLQLARGITDPRVLARLHGIDISPIAVTMRNWLRPRIAKLVDHVAPALAARDEPAAVDELAGLVGPRRISIGTQNLTALLQAVYDAPDDDAPRLVYADALLERSDPRGELVSLQLRLARGPDDRELRRREKELLDAHGKQWLGELAPIIASGFAFERGFLAECRIENRFIDRVKKLAGHPAWATVRAIEGSALIALHPVMRSLRRLSFVSYDARNHEGLESSWHDLLVGTERPIEELRYTGIASDRHWEDALERNESVRPGSLRRWVHVPQADELAALCSCAALPRLRSLVVAEEPELVAAKLLASPVARRLATLGFAYEADHERAPLRWFDSALREAPVPTLVFELSPTTSSGTMLRLDRGDRGYERVELEVGPTTAKNRWSEWLVDQAIGLLDVLPASVRELRITARRHTDPKQVIRLRTAMAQRARQLALDVCELSHDGH